MTRSQQIKTILLRVRTFYIDTPLSSSHVAPASTLPIAHVSSSVRKRKQLTLDFFMGDKVVSSSSLLSTVSSGNAIFQDFEIDIQEPVHSANVPLPIPNYLPSRDAAHSDINELDIGLHYTNTEKNE